MLPDTAFSWGPGASVVCTTSDGGAHWWSAFLGDETLGLAGNVTGELTAVVVSAHPDAGSQSSGECTAGVSRAVS